MDGAGEESAGNPTRRGPGAGPDLQLCPCVPAALPRRPLLPGRQDLSSDPLAASTHPIPAPSRSMFLELGASGQRVARRRPPPTPPCMALGGGQPRLGQQGAGACRCLRTGQRMRAQSLRDRCFLGRQAHAHLSINTVPSVSSIQCLHGETSISLSGRNNRYKGPWVGRSALGSVFQVAPGDP